MSMIRCIQCDKIYDTDFEFEVDDDGDCICDSCYDKNQRRKDDEADMPGGFQS